MLGVARLVQGGGAYAAWAGLLAWVTVATPTERRGEALGATYSAAFAGMLVGPLLGAIASGIGRCGVFLAAGLAFAAIAIWGGPAAPQRTVVHARGEPGAARAAPDVLRALGVIAVLGLVTGGLYSLGPLLLADRGVPPIGIATAFLLAAAPQVVLGPRVGRLIDRRGPGGFIAGSFVVTAVFLLAMAWPHNPWVVGALVAVSALAAFITFGPISLAITHAADRDRIGQGLAGALSTAGWGAGAAVGGMALTSLAQATSVGAALTSCAGACVITAVVIARGGAVRSIPGTKPPPAAGDNEDASSSWTAHTGGPGPFPP